MDTHIDILSEGIASGAVVMTDAVRKLTIGGITRLYPVYKVRLDYLYYNNQNDRIATWISQYKVDNDGQVPDPNNREEYNRVIESFIVESNPKAIKATTQNIREVDQREPAVVLYDGRIIDGNRRFTCLRQLAQENERFNYLETIILDKSVGSNVKQIKMLELSIQHGEEGKIDYHPVDVLVGLYVDIVETHLLSIDEYARSTNQKPSAVKKKIDVAKLMVEYLEFINAPQQYHIARELELNFPLEELLKMLKKCQSDEDAESLKICVFSNIMMRTSSDLGRFVRKIKDVISSPYYDDFIAEQTALSYKVLESLPPVGQVNSETLRQTIKNNAELSNELSRSMDKALAKVQHNETRTRPISILENASSLIGTVSPEMLVTLNSDETSVLSEQIDQIDEMLQRIRKAIEIQ